jgi:hypothetical protein
VWKAEGAVEESTVALTHGSPGSWEETQSKTNVPTSSILCKVTSTSDTYLSLSYMCYTKSQQGN